MLNYSVAELRQNKNDPSTVSEQINLVYPGGFQQFEKDFEAAYK